MGLLVDGKISTIQDLEAFDSAVVEVARVEGIQLSKKLLLSEQYVALQLKRFILSCGLDGQVGYVGGDVDLRKVAVTDGLQRWHALKTLETVYGDAYYRNLNDRYSAKKDWFAEQAREAWELLTVTGVGCVWNPVERAESPHFTPGGVPVAPGTYFAAISWRHANGAEGAVSEPVLCVVDEAQGIRITPRNAGAGIVGYEVYAGPAEDAMFKQNASTIPAGQTWDATAEITAAGTAAHDGQKPDFFLKKTRGVLRG